MNTLAIDTAWESLTSMARSLLDQRDHQSWALGEIVDTVQAHYGEHSILKFCESVKAKPKTMYQYRQVFKFYPRDIWKDYPLARYTQWRDAMYRLQDTPNGLAQALMLIALANDTNMRMKDFYAELDKVAPKKSTRVEPLFDKVVTVIADDEHVTFVCDAALISGGIYRIVVMEA